MIFLLSLIVRLVDLYSMVICVYVIMSWLPTNTGILADIYNVLGRICDPYLDLFKKLIPPIGGMIDITPIIALLVLQLAVRVLIGGVNVIY
ncbi:MAG: YggT family protein [Coriobacteriia bacterium]|nr:YggT family protein [Coriobacteriia bacterium]